jgi:LysR family nitrogen assimilation transcriptional regulator
MDLKHVRAFVAVAELGTVSKAAVRLHTTQPALSRLIIDLEGQLGFALFDRVARRLRLTAEGEQFLGNSRRLLGFANSLSEQARDLQRGDSGLLKVTASPQMIDNVLSGFLHRFSKPYPNVQVRLFESVGAQAFAMIERGEVLLGTAGHDAVPPGSDHFARRRLLTVTFLAAYHAPFELGGSRSIDIRALASRPLLLLDPGFVLRRSACACAARYPVRVELTPHPSFARRGGAWHCRRSVERTASSLHAEGGPHRLRPQALAGAAVDVLGQASLVAAVCA